LSDYELSTTNGRFQLQFDGLWTDTTMWELYSLSIINELRTRANLKRLSEFGLDILYAKAKTKLWSKIERLRSVPHLAVADFGTRRRHSFLWQEYVVEAMAANLGSGFTGTSNAFLAHKHDLEAIGTNAHEIPMVLAAIAPDDEALKASQYRVLEMWQQTYVGELRIMLPDTFGTTQFLEGATDWIADWTGQRVDSKDPYIAGDEYIEWLRAEAGILVPSASSLPTRSTSMTFSACTLILAALWPGELPPPISAAPLTFTIAESGLPTAAFASAPVGARCLLMIFAAAIRAEMVASTLSA